MQKLREFIRILARNFMNLRLNVDTLFTRLLLHLWGIAAGNYLRSSGVPIVHRFSNSLISIGMRCEMSNRTASNILGLAHPCMISTIAEGASIMIGDEVGMSGVTICARQRIVIGNEVLIGANVMILDNDFHALAFERRRRDTLNVAAAPIEIGDRVFIGTGAIILKGVKIGSGSIIGAGSVVTKEIPSNVVAAGNPARVVKTLG